MKYIIIHNVFYMPRNGKNFMPVWKMQQTLKLTKIYLYSLEQDKDALANYDYNSLFS